ncbi:MAG: hypothetical protein IRZ24_14305 [Thermogemmatispora sp.]|uniref:hypothetical protein n=2 Tax=Thermogemmatispora sp. TaxID=1968838 RepID=UPI001DB04F43|nr:hypothetical protein [Thermogemmatispora sp.]MBX5451233.1 hypothetical protein [Thermogemmatispora sp.]
MTMTGSPERPLLQEPRPDEESAGMGEADAATAKREQVVKREEQTLSRTAVDAVEREERKPAAAEGSEIAHGEHGTGAEATLERQAVAVRQQGREALIIPSLDTRAAEHDADTLPLERPAQHGAGQPPAFYSTPTVPVAPQESRHVTQPPRRWFRDRLRPEASRQAPRHAPGEPNFKRLWIGTLIASLLLLLLSVSLLIYLLTVLAAREGLSPALLLSATASGKLAGTQHGQAEATTELALFPQSLSPANCLPDNGYRCTVTLLASGPAGSVHWQAWSQGVAARINPPSGSIEPGQQQQLIIYLPGTCPASGKIMFSWNNRQLSLPWRC